MTLIKLLDNLTTNMLLSVVKAAEPNTKNVTSLSIVIDIFNSKENTSLKLVYSNIHTLIRLFLTVPLSNLRPEADKHNFFILHMCEKQVEKRIKIRPRT